MITLGEYEQREKRLGPARASAGDNTYARQRGTAYVSNSVSEEVHEDEAVIRSVNLGSQRLRTEP